VHTLFQCEDRSKVWTLFPWGGDLTLHIIHEMKKYPISFLLKISNENKKKSPPFKCQWILISMKMTDKLYLWRNKKSFMAEVPYIFRGVKVERSTLNATNVEQKISEIQLQYDESTAEIYSKRAHLNWFLLLKYMVVVKFAFILTGGSSFYESSLDIVLVKVLFF